MCIRDSPCLKRRKKIQANESKFFRSTQEYSLLAKKRNEDNRQELEVESLHKKIKNNKKLWCQHFYRMPNNNLSVAAFKYELNGEKGC